ncbi:MAG TPA: O-antigen ligase family protein [Nitrospira sp.]|nr:O-antigen ligase family protein [Nitrospira sp.]MCW5796061.1 O-antigen ligase family protein [Nitrospira sp.]HMU30128.1 O-antigen ligase family protein [Nitrospira sp.]HMV58410.1 O-antigen ligase family protein [Nitrospira sp.]HMW86694.1 O-antigen ligase family protein [Nitrospira sp.]
MKPSDQTYTIPTLLGATLGASVLALSTKALAIVIACSAFLSMTASAVFPYYILVATIPVQVDLLGGLTVTKLITPLAIGMVTINALIHRGPWPVLLRWPAGYLAGAFFLASLLSLVLAEGLRGLPGEAAKIPVYGALFFFTLTFNRHPEDMRRLLWVITITGVGEALITAAQVHYGFVMPGDWRRNVGLPSEGGVDGAFMSISEGKVRAEGTTAHPIFLASFFLMSMPCTAFLLFQEKHPWVKAALGAMLSLMAYAWFYTFARSSVIGFALLILVGLWLQFKFVRKLSLIVLVLVLAGGLSYQVVSEWFQVGVQTVENQNLFGKADLNEGSGSFAFRRESIVGGWNLFLAHPWFGVGFGQAINHYVKYLPAWADHYYHPAVIHNMFLEVASELGVFSLSAFIGLWVVAFVSLKRGLRIPDVRPYAVLLSSILAGQMIFLMITPMVREIWLTLPMAIAIGHMAKTHTRATFGIPFRQVGARAQLRRIVDRGNGLPAGLR